MDLRDTLLGLPAMGLDYDSRSANSPTSFGQGLASPLSQAFGGGSFAWSPPIDNQLGR